MELTVTRRKKNSRRASYMEVQNCYTTVVPVGKDKQSTFLIFGDVKDSVIQEHNATIVLSKLELEHLFHLIKARLEDFA